MDRRVSSLALQSGAASKQVGVEHCPGAQAQTKSFDILCSLFPFATTYLKCLHQVVLESCIPHKRTLQTAIKYKI